MWPWERDHLLTPGWDLVQTMDLRLAGFMVGMFGARGMSCTVVVDQETKNSDHSVSRYIQYSSGMEIRSADCACVNFG